MADLMDEAIEISHKLIPCNICGRTFLPAPLKKHAKVCEKNATKKRKTFNSLKQRIEGTELAVFHQKSYLRGGPQQPPQVTVAAAVLNVPVDKVQVNHHAEKKPNQSKWKEKHEQLVQAIRAAKGEKIMAPRRSISAVGSMGTTEQCPTCDRHFGPKAYDRHVEWCKEHKIRASKSPAIVTIAKERLEARTKYRVPPLNKSKRTLTRDKYASPSGRNHSQDSCGGGGGGGGSVMNVRSTSSLDQQQHGGGGGGRKHKQKHAAAAAAAFVEQPVIKHNSEKLKSLSTSMSTTHNNQQKSEKDDYDPFIIAEKQLMDLLQGDDFKPYKNKTPSPKTKLKSLPLSLNSINTKQKSFDLHQHQQDDNFEIIENFINDNFQARRKYSNDEINSIDPKLINATDNLKIPEQLLYGGVSLLEPLVLPKTERTSQPITDADFEEFISSFIYDDLDDDGLPTLKTKTSKSNYSFGGNKTQNSKNPLSPLKRSVSLLNPVVKARSMKNKQDIQDYLHVRDRKLRPFDQELYPVDHDMYEDYKKYEEMYKREQQQNETRNNINNNINDDDDDNNYEDDDCVDLSSNEEDVTPPLPLPLPQKQQAQPHAHKHKQKLNADSAYGSLNRKSPKTQQTSQNNSSRQQKTSTPQMKQQRSPSSSGSDTCTSVQATPKLQQKQLPPQPPPQQQKSNRLTKFCHECGTKYPLDCAKFCVECGIKRLVL